MSQYHIQEPCVFPDFSLIFHGRPDGLFLIEKARVLRHTDLMEIRNAQVKDVNQIHALISDSAEHDRMLFRSKADLYENLQTFLVAEEAGEVVGCCALELVWADLAEIKSLAVDARFRGKEIGRQMVQGAVDRGRVLGVPRVFALTLEPGFFDRLGFQTVAKETLPMKVWRDCARCPKQQRCDEIAMLKTVQTPS